jgi:hypothetical protein
VNRGNAERKVLPRFRSWDGEACLLDHLRESGLRREPFDRLDEVLVRVAVGGNDVAEVGDHLEGVEIVGSTRAVCSSS